jgi:hypothetical protein
VVGEAVSPRNPKASGPGAGFVDHPRFSRKGEIRRGVRLLSVSPALAAGPPPGRHAFGGMNPDCGSARNLSFFQRSSRSGAARTSARSKTAPPVLPSYCDQAEERKILETVGRGRSEVASRSASKDHPGRAAAGASRRSERWWRAARGGSWRARRDSRRAPALARARNDADRTARGVESPRTESPGAADLRPGAAVRIDI